jgi:hypothetical protein
MLTLRVCRDGRKLSRRRIGQGVVVRRPDPHFGDDSESPRTRGISRAGQYTGVKNSIKVFDLAAGSMSMGCGTETEAIG